MRYILVKLFCCILYIELNTISNVQLDRTTSHHLFIPPLIHLTPKTEGFTRPVYKRKNSTKSNPNPRITPKPRQLCKLLPLLALICFETSPSGYEKYSQTKVFTSGYLFSRQNLPFSSRYGVSFNAGPSVWCSRS